MGRARTRDTDGPGGGRLRRHGFPGPHPRRFRIFGPIRRRLFWRFYATLMLGLMAMVLVGGFIWRNVAHPPFPPGYELETRLVQSLLPPAGASEAEIESALRRLASSFKARVSLIGPDGQTIAAAGRGEERHMLFDGPPDRLPPRGRTFRTWRVDLDDGRILVARGLSHFIDEPPAVFLYLFGVAAAIGIVAYPVVGRITRRLELLRQTAEDWGNGKLDARVPEIGEDEIGAVSRSFNAAAAQIQALIAANKSLLAHASHELRSPLARLRMAVEVFELAPTAELKRTIAADIAELDTLVEEILLASRLDHAGIVEAREAVDLIALAAEEAARTGATLADIPPDAPAEIVGSPRLLRRLIRNLLENARRHGRAPVEIRIGTAPGESGPLAGHVRFSVGDHGPGIPAAERDRIFEPFYRPAGHAESGSNWGLGLALVRRIAASHGGTVTCKERPGGGALFEVDLPVG